MGSAVLCRWPGQLLLDRHETREACFLRIQQEMTGRGGPLVEVSDGDTDVLRRDRHPTTVGASASLTFFIKPFDSHLDIGARMPFAINGSARLHWEERGEGTPLLLVMGHSYSSSMWYLAVDELAQQHRVITFDNRGTGKSSPMRKTSVAEMAADAFAVMGAAGATSAHVYGVSMGGGILLEMARQHPERIRSLLLGCTMAKTPDTPGIPVFLRPLLHLPAPLLAALLKRLAGPDKPHPYGTRAPADRVAKDIEAVAASTASTAASVAQSRAIYDYSITADEVRALTMPALVLHGDEDTTVPYEAGVRLHELLSHSEMLTLTGAGHNYFVAGGDEANKAVLDFLSRTDEHAAV